MVLSSLLSERIQARLNESSDSVLVRDEDGTWTGSEIASALRPLCHLLELSTPIRSPVIVSFPNSAAGALSILGVIMANRVPVILSPSDLQLQPSLWFERIQPSLILADRNYEAALEQRFSVARIDAQFKIQPFRNFFHSPNSEQRTLIPNGTALTLFTSGSTGIPKGVFVPAAGIVTTADFLIKHFKLNEHSVSSVVLPISHSMGLNTHFFPTFLAGGQSHFTDLQLSLPKIYRSLLETKGTDVALIGEVLWSLAKEKQKRNLPFAESVKNVQLAGGMISPSHVKLAKHLFPNSTVHKGYGLTEAIRVTLISDDDPDFFTDSVGFPLPFNEVTLHSENRIISVPRQVGEISVRGPNTYRGNLGSDLARNPSEMIRTGDLGYWNERGQLCIVGRDDGLFKFNGHRVSGAQIERTVLEISQSIRNAKCLLVDDTQSGRPKIALFLEVASLHEIETLGVRVYEGLKHLPHPVQKVYFMLKFPTTSNGKVSLSLLRQFQAELDEESATLPISSPAQFYHVNSERIAE